MIADAEGENVNTALGHFLDKLRNLKPNEELRMMNETILKILEASNWNVARLQAFCDFNQIELSSLDAASFEVVSMESGLSNNSTWSGTAQWGTRFHKIPNLIELRTE